MRVHSLPRENPGDTDSHLKRTPADTYREKNCEGSQDNTYKIKSTELKPQIARTHTHTHTHTPRLPFNSCSYGKLEK